MSSMEPRAEARPMIVVVGHDYSETSSYAMATAQRIIAPSGGAGVLHVVHATSSAVVDPAAIALPGLVPVAPSAVDAARERLESACAVFAQATSAEVIPHLVYGDPARGIAAVAREAHADLIVVGTRRRRGITLGWHRSLSARLVRLAPCSVLTTRPREEDEEVKVEPPCEACVEVRRASEGKVLWCARHTAHRPHGHLHHGDAQAFVHGSWDFRT
jgi:nucleotide-binding universal stress UspA family protein